jgi:hypothetical protein
VSLRLARLIAATVAIAGLAVTGCGGEERAARGPAPAAPEQADTVDLAPLSTAQAARRADRVAVVVARGSRVVEGAPGTPFTRTRFAVQDVLKGRLPHEFVVQVIGGRMRDVLVPSPVQPFTRSRRYVLFLGPDGPAGPTIFPQSVIELTRGSNGALRSLRRSLRGSP